MKVLIHWTVAITIPTLNTDNGDFEVDVGDQQDLQIYCDAPVNGLNFSLWASGVEFDQDYYYIPPGHTYSHASFVAVSHGLSSVKITVSGVDAPLYTVSQPTNSVRVVPLSLSSSMKCGNNIMNIISLFFCVQVAQIASMLERNLIPLLCILLDAMVTSVPLPLQLLVCTMQ